MKTLVLGMTKFNLTAIVKYNPSYRVAGDHVLEPALLGVGSQGTSQKRRLLGTRNVLRFRISEGDDFLG